MNTTIDLQIARRDRYVDRLSHNFEVYKQPSRSTFRRKELYEGTTQITVSFDYLTS